MENGKYYYILVENVATYVFTEASNVIFKRNVENKQINLLNIENQILNGALSMFQFVCDFIMPITTTVC